MKRNRVAVEPLPEMEWGRVPDDYRTQSFFKYPNARLLAAGTLISPDQVRSLIKEEMPKVKGAHDMELIKHLRCYAELFPNSKWLSISERLWLNRPDGDFYF